MIEDQPQNDDIRVQLAAALSKLEQLEGRLDSMERGQDAKMNSIAEEVLSTLTINNGQQMSFTGSGKNITGNYVPGQGWTGTLTLVCNGDSTITATIAIPGM